MIVLFLCVSYEVPAVYGSLETLFDFCYKMIFPVGVIISSLEGWRVGCEGDNEVRDKVWEVRACDSQRA